MDNSNLNKEEVQDNENIVDNNVNSNNDVNGNVNPMVNNSLNDNVNNTLNANTEVASSIESNEVKASPSEITPLKEVEEVKVNQENQNVNKDIEPENNEKVNQTNGKKINSFEISLIIIIILLIVVIGIILYKTYFTDKKEDNKNNTNDNENGEVAKPNEGEYTLNIYKTEGGLFTSVQENGKELIATIEAETKEATVIGTGGSNDFVLYKDKVIKIYDIKNKKIISTNLSINYRHYAMYVDKGEVLGITYIDEYTEYYNIKLNKSMYEDSNYELFNLNSDYLIGMNNEKFVILSRTEEKEINTYPENLDGLTLKEFKYQNKEFSVVSLFFDGGDNVLGIYDSNKKAIVSSLENKISSYDIRDNYLYAWIDNTIKKYDIDGNLLKTIDDINDIKVMQIIKNYVVCIDNDYLTLLNIDTKDTKQIAKWNNENYSYSYYYSGYYDKDKIKEKNKNGEAGIYLIVSYNNADGNYGMEYCYTDDEKIVTYPAKERFFEPAYKPVLYLYPTEETNIKVEFEHPEYLMTTYPKYTNSWNVTAYPNGDLYDEDNKYYYALYWDEKIYKKVDFKEGFYVTKENAISFLEEKLDIIGLNKKEKNEFIMYWLPILERNEKNLVYFELTEERESYNKLLITPKPKSLLRILMHIKKADGEIEIKEQHLEKFKREGFVAVEWGGMTY